MPGESDATARDLPGTASLLEELARRFRLRFGTIEVVFHDGRPSPRVRVEHRLQVSLQEIDRDSPPVQRRGQP